MVIIHINIYEKKHDCPKSSISTLVWPVEEMTATTQLKDYSPFCGSIVAYDQVLRFTTESSTFSFFGYCCISFPEGIFFLNRHDVMGYDFGMYFRAYNIRPPTGSLDYVKRNLFNGRSKSNRESFFIFSFSFKNYWAFLTEPSERIFIEM